ncbi:MAG: spore photoproduct lyase family protein [archaeon]
MKIKEVHCKSLLNKTGLSCDYCINPYTGCSNNCVYCYARFMLRYTNHKEEWGSFVDVKVNAVDVLQRELRKAKPGSIFISSVTDAYQAVESKYKLTRRILEVLPKNFTPYILTKSALVTRDIDILRGFKRATVGFTITSLNDWKNFEPNSSPVEDRIKALKKVHDAGIKTNVFLGPVLPYITDKDLEILMERIGFVDSVMVDRLNIKCGNWPRIKDVVLRDYPDLYDKFAYAVFEDDSYFFNFKKTVKNLRRNVKFIY